MLRRTKAIRFARWHILWLLLIACPAAGRASNAYALDQTNGSIEFSVGLFHLFSSHGVFHRFGANLWLDDIHPYQSKIMVTVDAGSAQMDRPGATDILLSPDFFDTGRFPRIRFASMRITQQGPGHYTVEGSLEIRGISRPFVLDTRLVAEHHDAGSGLRSRILSPPAALNARPSGWSPTRCSFRSTIDITIHARLALASGFHVG